MAHYRLAVAPDNPRIVTREYQSAGLRWLLVGFLHSPSSLTGDAMMSRRIRLCVLMGSHFSARMGGAQYQAHHISQFLASTGEYDIHYVARRIARDHPEYGYSLVNLGVPSGLRKWGFVFDGRRLAKVLHRLRPDILYIRGVKGHTALGAAYARQSGAKLVIHIAHDYDVDKKKRLSTGPLGWLEEAASIWGMRRADAIIAQTQRQSILLEEQFGRRAELIVPNCHPYPEGKIEKYPGVINVVWVANIKPNKRPDAFVRLARRFQDEGIMNVRFFMVGRSDGGEYANRLVERAKGVDVLSYLGELPVEDVHALLASSHILVNTSIAEGFPNTFIQAWMRKVPVVSLGVDVDGILKAGRVGRLCANEECLFAEILRLCLSNSVRDTMGELARYYSFKAFATHRFEEIHKLLGDLYGRNDSSHRVA